MRTAEFLFESFDPHQFRMPLSEHWPRFGPQRLLRCVSESRASALCLASKAASLVSAAQFETLTQRPFCCPHFARAMRPRGFAAISDWLHRER
jgi:hypothetical protein